MSADEARVSQLRALLATAVESTFEEFRERSEFVTSRQLLSAASFSLRTGTHQCQAEEVIRAVLDHQWREKNHTEEGAFVQSLFADTHYGNNSLTFVVEPHERTPLGILADCELGVEGSEGASRLALWFRSEASFKLSGYHQIELFIDGRSVWSRDATQMSGEGWQEVQLDVPTESQRKSCFVLRALLIGKKEASNLPVAVQISDVRIGNSSDGEKWAPTAWDVQQYITRSKPKINASPSFDINSTSFCLLILGSMLGSGDIKKLPGELQKRCLEAIALAVERIREDPVAQLGYTNARLIRDISLVLVGKHLNFPEVQEIGMQNFLEWMRYTRENGIREYGSTVYYAVSVEALMLGYAYNDDHSFKRDLVEALNIFWWDISANYFPARRSLSGSRSRDPNYMTGSGSLETILYLEGWREDCGEVSILDVQKLLAFSDNSYSPPNESLAMSLSAPKEIIARSDPDANLDRYNYVTSTWAMGSTSKTFTNVIPGQGGPTPNDRPISIELGDVSGPGLISFVPEANGFSYGQKGHLPLFPSVVQERGRLLAHLDLNPSLVRSEGLRTNLIVPLSVSRILVDGSEVSLVEGGHYSGSRDTVLSVVTPHTYVGIRLIDAEEVDDGPLKVCFRIDDFGRMLNLGRLEVQHFTASVAKRPSAEHAYLGFFIEVRDLLHSGDVEKFQRELRALEFRVQRDDFHFLTSVTTSDGQRYVALPR